MHQLSLSASPVIAQESEAEVEPEPQLLSQAQLNPQPVADVPEPMPEEEPEPVSQSPLSRVQLSAVPVRPSETVANTEPASTPDCAQWANATGCSFIGEQSLQRHSFCSFRPTDGIAASWENAADTIVYSWKRGWSTGWFRYF